MDIRELVIPDVRECMVDQTIKKYELKGYIFTLKEERPGFEIDIITCKQHILFDLFFMREEICN